MLVGILRLSGFFSESALSADEIHRIDGEPDREAPSALADTLTLVSWNIAYGRKCEPHADVLASFEPDVRLPQEADVGCRRSDFRNVARSDPAPNRVSGNQQTARLRALVRP